MKLTWRVWLLIIVLLGCLLMISPNFKSGVLVQSVALDSEAYQAGIRSGMIIKEIDGYPISNLNDYLAISGSISGTEEKVHNVRTSDNDFTFLSTGLNFSVDSIPRTRIKTGLDLRGGSRAFVKTVNVSLTPSQLQDLVEVTSQRLNAFGLSDISVRPVSDLGGNNYMMVEAAGAKPEDLRELVGKQGKFEAKIGNDTAFVGGSKDITDVCRNDATCAGITACSRASSSEYVCRFSFTIYLSEEAARRHAEITKGLSVDYSSGGQYLSQPLKLILDDVEVDSLLISRDLQGSQTTQISIQGSGTGVSQEEALEAAQASMKKLQTILITGSLPYKLEIVKLDTISPTLGKEFTESLILLGIAVFIVVSICIFARYRKIKLSLAVMLTMFAEAFITIGIAAFIGWNLDAPGIAGIIAGIGTGVGDQILLLDAAVKGKENSNMRDRIKLAFFVIVGSFATNVASMLPLFWTGAGMLKGFALTTILGVSVGILITRPAFADIVGNMEN